MKNTNKNSLSIPGFCLILLTVLFAFSQAHAHAQTVAYKRPAALPTNLGLSSVLRLNDSANGTTLRGIMMLPTIYRIKENPDGSTNLNTPANIFSAFADPTQGGSAIDIGAFELQSTPTPTYTVDTNADDGSLNACTAAANDCSLRGAINNANASADNDIIGFDASLTNTTITLASGTASTSPLTIANNGSLAINGLGAANLKVWVTQSNTECCGAFIVAKNAVVTMSGLTISNGLASGGGGIANSGVLTLNNMSITGNFGENGGGIFNEGTLTVNNSSFSKNANFGGGFSYSVGGAIYSAGTLTVTNSTFYNNSTKDYGGAVFIENGTATFSNVTFASRFRTDNAFYGGAIAVKNAAATLSNVTISGHRASYEGGGIYNDSGTVTLDNTIVAGNRVNTFLFHNGSPDVGGANTLNPNRTLNPYISNGYNLIGTTDGSSGWVSTDKTGTIAAPLDAKLLLLADNGGPTQTMALDGGSPAIDAGNSTLTTDQRGLPRPSGNAADIGAFERQNIAPTDIALSNATMPDNTPSGTTVGTFSTTDQPSDSHTYSLVSGAGDGDNASFVIEGNALKTAVTFNYATKSSYSIRVETRDSGGLTFQKSFTVSVTNDNYAPTDIALSNTSVAENSGIGTTVGSFSTTDRNVDNAHAYSLVTGTGDGDNASFFIEGNALKTAAIFDFETRSSYSIRVQTLDSGGLTFQKAFIINVGNVNEEPPSLVVTTLADGVAEDGVTTLREAVNYANSDGVDSAITFAVSGTIRLGSTLPALANNGTLSITGPQAGITISGISYHLGTDGVTYPNPAVRILTVSTGANVTLDKLNLRDGKIEGDAVSGGGAINNFGTLKVSNSTLANNFARPRGGAINNLGTLTVTGSTLADNSAYDGGAIFNNGTLTVTGSTLAGNTAYESGGAILNGGSGTLTVTGSTLVHNNASDGGAIRNVRTATIINCTLAGNKAIYGGGAIHNTRTLTMTNSTLAYNSSDNGAGAAIYNYGGGITWKNNLFANNHGSNETTFSGLTNPTSSGDANKNYSFVSLDAAGLSWLADNGGPTQTMALSPTSPVVNKGLDTTLAPDSLSTDQRGTGYARKGGSAVDIGAFEIQDSTTTATAINTQPQNQSVCESAPANFSVGATGTTLTYQWRKGGVNLIDGATISGATSANLMISSAATSNAGSYDVVVTGAQGAATSNAATLTVNSAPAITNQPSDQSVNPGANATFTAAADRAESIKWQISTDGGTSFSDISGATAATLNLSAVTSAQSGNKYRAVFSGACGNPVNSSAATLTVGKLNQTITFASPGTKTYGDAAFNLGGTSTSGLTVSYTIVSGPATVSGSTLTITGAGSVTVRASQDGNDSYNAAPSETRSFTVNKAAATVNLSGLNKTYTGTAQGATASTIPADLNVGITYNDSATVPTAVGSYAVVATINDANYKGTANGTLVIAKANQTITFGALSNKTFGDPAFALSATASSGLSVSFAVTGNCSLANGSLTITGAGTCMVTASQAGNSDINAASSVPQSFNIAKASQVIGFTSVPSTNTSYTDTYTPTAIGGGSGNPVTFSATGACSISNGVVTMNKSGTCTVTASQLGNSNFNPGVQSQLITVGKLNAVTTYTGDSYAVTAGPTISTAAIRLSATVARTGGSTTGDLSLAVARFDILKFSGAPYTSVTAPIDVNGNAVLTINVPASDDPYTVKVNIDSGNFYWQSQPDLGTPLAVILGTTERRIAGGGWIADQQSRNGKGNFGFNAGYLKNGSPKGNAVYVFRGVDGYDYQVKTNSWSGGGLSFTVDGDTAKASFTARATVQRVDPKTGLADTTWNSGGFTMTVDTFDGDLKNPRQADQYAITILDGSGAIWRQVGTRAARIQLGGGNVSVQSK